VTEEGSPAPHVGSAEIAAGLDGAAVLTAYAIAPKTHWIVFVQQPLAEAFATVYRSLLRTLALLGLGLALAVVSGVLLARRMVAPIRLLQAGAEKLGTGDLSQRLDIRTGDEIEALAGSFNQMAERIKESYETLEAKVFARTNDLNEALERQTATANVLKVISRSVSDATPVFETIVESYQRLFGLDAVAIYLVEGEVVRGVAQRGWDGGDWGKDAMPLAGSSTGLAIAERRAIHFPDLADKPDMSDKFRVLIREAGDMSVLYAPMLLDDRGVGSIVVSRKPARPFSDKEIALVQSFADQAAIAIQNTRLFNETQEALEQLKASADVLGAIGRSVSDTSPVFEEILNACQRLFGSEEMGIYTVGDDNMVRVAAWRGETRAEVRRDVTPLEDSITGRIIRERRTHHIPDLRAEPNLSPTLRERVERLGSASLLYAPMLWEDHGLGSILVVRSPPRAFNARETALLQTFADQAAIAIQNARLFNETQESLAQQTATADVLKVISRSAFDLDAVLDTLVTSAGKLCGADGGIIWLRQGEKLHAGATFGHSPEATAFFKAHPRGLGDKSLAPRVMHSGRTEHIPDRSRDPDFSFPGLAMPDSMLGVPMFRNGGIEGVFTLSRAHASAFSPRQIELVESFADQAVIAIENARLFEEVQAKTRDLEESLAQQTATADVLKAISRTAFDLDTVLDTLISTAARLCNANLGQIFRRHGDVYRYAASRMDVDPAYLQHEQCVEIKPGRGTLVGRVALENRAVSVTDAWSDPEYEERDEARVGNVRAMLGVPLMRGGEPIGAFALARSAPIPFTERQIELVTTFADQAVIAIENVRLFDEVQARTRELAASLEDLQQTQDRLVQTEKLASLGQLTAGIAHEIKNPLNFVNNFSSLSRELLDELSELVRKTSLEEDVRNEAVELITMAQGNLDKVVQHGKRADSIVKNMLLHSRQGSGERSTTNINPLVEEALNLAYHGARAEKPGFNATIVKQLDPSAGAAELYPQEITRVLLNLINNAFYATGKRAGSEKDSGYEPTVTVLTRDRGNQVEIVIRDNGTGAPPEVKEKMFNPFFTTKPAGEGTGLGLSLSHDIIVKQHGGAIEVESELGSFTEFVIRLPRTQAAATL
jgi:GAF domain-containing protein/HAMP domain-containing protein